MIEGFESTGDARDWEELHSQARSNNEHSLGELLERYRFYLTLVAERDLDRDLRAKVGASDLVQETYQEAITGFSQFRGNCDAELKTWLLQILSNNLNDHRKRYRKTAKRDISREISTSAIKSSLGLLQVISNGDPSPSTLMRRRERDEQLEIGLSHLNERYRRVILLRHYENLRFHEISEMMGLSEQAARKLWARAIHSLQRELGHDNG